MQPRDLVDVLAVGESQVIGDTTLTLLSLERYRDGFVAQFQLHWEYKETPPTAAETLSAHARLMPEMQVSAVDNRGGAYASWPHGGSGGDGRGLKTWRYAFRFAPALDGAATAVEIRVAHIAWRRFDPATGELRLERQVGGPWRFTVPLP